MNLSITPPINWSNPVLLNPNTPYLAEEVCKPYISSLNKFYLSVAIFNFSYSFFKPTIEKLNKKYKERFWFRTEINNYPVAIHPFDTTLIILDGLFFILNAFVFGYWLALRNTWIMNIPVLNWFIQ